MYNLYVSIFNILLILLVVVVVVFSCCCSYALDAGDWLMSYKYSTLGTPGIIEALKSQFETVSILELNNIYTCIYCLRFKLNSCCIVACSA